MQQITGSDTLGETLILLIVLRWKPVADAKLYRLEIQDEDSKNIFSSIALPSSNEYRLPSFIRELAAAKRLNGASPRSTPPAKTPHESTFNEVK